MVSSAVGPFYYPPPPTSGDEPRSIAQGLGGNQYLQAPPRPPQTASATGAVPTPLVIYSPGAATATWQFTTIRRLRSLALAAPLAVSVEADEDAFLAKATDIPGIFGFADTASEAVQDLKDQIEELYHELQDGSEYSAKWQNCLAFLKTIVTD
jgi:predicted RNase H-like HicB family nuclease